MLFFSRDLSVDEKNVYMEALAFILNVGKSNNDAKKEYMETQMAEIGLSKKDFRSAKKVKTAGELAKDIKGIGDIKIKRFILREMILLALADHELTDEEIQTIYQIGTCSGLKEEKSATFSCGPPRESSGRLKARNWSRTICKPCLNRRF